MKVENVGSKIQTSLWVWMVFIVCSTGFSQITEGRVVFERKTNLEKRYKGVDIGRWARNADLKKPKIDEFELIFNDSASIFRPIESDIPDNRSWFTMRNTTYQNLNEDTRKQEFSFFGTTVLLKDSLRQRTWRMTESKREIAGYNCRQALWVANDTIRIYAWFAEELISSAGPETFNGLPGVILGLALEDGGVVYFAKKVEQYTEDIEKLAPKGKEKDWYTEGALKTLMDERFGSFGSAMQPFIMDVFIW